MAQERCVWPNLEEPYLSALKDAVAFILARFEVMGIIASGTIIRGKPDPLSDLDIFVLHRELVRQRIQKRFRGIPAEIFVNPPMAVERYFASDHKEGRPISAHMWATGFVVYATDPIVETLREKARQFLQERPVYSPPTLTQARYSAATWYEDTVDVVVRDPATAQMLLSQSVFSMLQYFFQSQQRFIPRQKEWLDEIGKMDAALGQQVMAFYTSESFSVRLELAERIADRILGERGFFEWESELEIVSNG